MFFFMNCTSTEFVRVMENLERYGVLQIRFRAWKVMEILFRSWKVQL